MLAAATLVIGNFLTWNSEVETTQTYTGWVFGMMMLSVSGGVPGRIPRSVAACIAVLFVMAYPHRVTTPKDPLACVNGREVVVGVPMCECDPPWTGELCDVCPTGAIRSMGFCGPLCHPAYEYPQCTRLGPGYASEHVCKPNFVTSCDIPGVERTFPNATVGIRARLYTHDSCVYNGVQHPTYCLKCRTGNGRYCCEDGTWGPDCRQSVPRCDGDNAGAPRPNEIPDVYTPMTPLIGDTCGGEVIGDHLCASGLCHPSGNCYSVSAVPSLLDRCECTVGVGPLCKTEPCYGGTRSWIGGMNGKASCECTSAYNNATDACEITYQDVCYPDLYDNGVTCEECQCRLGSDYGACPKKYDVFVDGCVKTGICTATSTDCGEKLDGVSDRCLLRVDEERRETVVFDGDLCQDMSVPCPWQANCQL